MLEIRKIKSLDEADIKKFIDIRKKSLIDDVWSYNLITYPEEEIDFTINWYKKYNFLKNYYIIEYNNKFIWYAAYSQQWVNNYQWNHNFMIWPIYIDSDFRWNWLWKKLMLELIKNIKNKYRFEILNLNLLVNKNSNIAISLYESLWFKRLWIYNNYIKTKEWNFFDVIIMNKSIVDN